MFLLKKYPKTILSILIGTAIYYLKKFFFPKVEWDPFKENKITNDNKLQIINKSTDSKKITKVKSIPDSNKLSKKQQEFFAKQALQIVGKYIPLPKEAVIAHLFPTEKNVKTKLIVFGNKKGKIVGLNSFAHKELKIGGKLYKIITPGIYFAEEYRRTHHTFHHVLREMLSSIFFYTMRGKNVIWADIMTVYSYSLMKTIVSKSYPAYNKKTPNKIAGLMNNLIKEFKLTKKPSKNKNSFVVESPFPFKIPSKDYERFKKSNNPNIKFFCKNTEFAKSPGKYQMFVCIPINCKNIMWSSWHAWKKIFMRYINNLCDHPSSFQQSPS
jgi:hypothetical protein